MKIVAVTPAADASDPAHPDHDRWVKDVTLKMEVAEANNRRLLDRAERIAKDKPSGLVKKRKPPSVQQERQRRKSRLQRLQERAVTVKAAQPLVSPLKLSPCGRCGTCRACMRERRVLAIIEKARAGDLSMLNLAWQMTATALDAQGGTGRYRDMNKADRDRAVTAKAEFICDQSVRWLGNWI